MMFVMAVETVEEMAVETEVAMMNAYVHSFPLLVLLHALTRVRGLWAVSSMPHLYGRVFKNTFRRELNVELLTGSAPFEDIFEEVVEIQAG
jgi:hypothetical protein